MSKQNSKETTCDNCTSAEAAYSFYFSMKNDAYSSQTGTFSFSLTTTDSGNFTVISVKKGTATYSSISNSTISLQTTTVTGTEDMNFTFSLGTVGARTQTDVEILVKKKGGDFPFKATYSAKATLTKGGSIALANAAVTANSVNVPESSGSSEDPEDDEDLSDNDNSTDSLLEGGGDHNEQGAIAAISVVLSLVGIAVIIALVFFYLKARKGSAHDNHEDQASELGNEDAQHKMKAEVKLEEVNISGGIRGP